MRTTSRRPAAVASRVAARDPEGSRRGSSEAEGDEACFDCGGRGFITRGRLPHRRRRGERPRCLSTTGVTCLGTKTTRPWCRLSPPSLSISPRACPSRPSAHPRPSSPHPSPRVPPSVAPLALTSPSLHLTLFYPLALSHPAGNPFPQTKGSRGPSTSIYLRRHETRSTSRSCLPLRYVIRM